MREKDAAVVDPYLACVLQEEKARTCQIPQRTYPWGLGLDAQLLSHPCFAPAALLLASPAPVR